MIVCLNVTGLAHGGLDRQRKCRDEFVFCREIGERMPIAKRNDGPGEIEG